MVQSRVDSSIQRIEIDGVAFPLGVYPVEEMKPRTGYTVHFEPADGDDGEWEEWPDRYVFDIFVSATRVEALCRLLFSLLPGRIYPILDMLGQDEYREIDPFVSYDLVSQDRFLDGIRRFRDFFFEDGLVGFGAMSEEPFVYVFVDEHKIVTVRVEAALRERVEALLAAFDLNPVDEIAGADAATHEHRTVLDAPENRPDLLTVDEVVEDLREDWGLVLNIDPESNLDDEGNDLGITAWRCIVRHEPNNSQPSDNGDEPGAPTTDATGNERQAATPAGATPPVSEPPLTAARPRYAELYLAADCLSEAERLVGDAMERLAGDERSPDGVDIPVSMERIRPETLTADLEALGARKKGDAPPEITEPRVLFSRWLD